MLRKIKTVISDKLNILTEKQQMFLVAMVAVLLGVISAYGCSIVGEWLAHLYINVH